MYGTKREAIRRPTSAMALVLFCVLCLVTALVAPVPVGAEDDPLVDVYATENADGSYGFFANNNHIVPVFVRVGAQNLINLTADRSLPVAFGLEPGEHGVLIFTLTPTRATGRRGYGLQYSFAQGNPDTARHDDTYLYLLPFAHGEKFRLSQGFHGRFTHTGDNEFAVDFEMDTGTEIYAARGGIVAEVKEDSSVGGPSAGYSDDTNYILVLHEDGSFGNYAHLVKDGAIVEPGTVVDAGQLLGYSGNTGRSSGPHLHFDVRLPTYEGKIQSVPFLFRGGGGEGLTPTEGTFYHAYHPGGPEFEESYGREITMESYAGYREPVDGPYTLDTRVEQIDLTFLLFVRNGLADSTDVEVKLQLSGLASDAGNTVRMMVPARSEVLATILRPLPGATSIQYGYTISYTR
jgi:murein DD-endopeptidase MepM/ murein hydrolase activator NlpD